MESNLYKGVINYIIMPNGFSVATHSQPKVAINSSLEYMEEATTLKHTADVQGFNIQGSVPVIAIHWRGNLDYVIGVPIVANTMDSNSFISLSGTVNVDQVGSVVGTDFVKALNPDLRVTAELNLVPTDVERCYRVECIFKLPDLLTSASSRKGNTIEKQRQVLTSLREKIGRGKDVLEMVRSLGQSETKTISSRANERRGGRPSKMDADKIEEAKKLMQDPQYTISQICKVLEVSKSTLYRHLSE